LLSRNSLNENGDEFLFAPLLHPSKLYAIDVEIPYVRVTGRLENGHTLTGVAGSDPTLSAIIFTSINFAFSNL
jgi:hypothetical protein